MNPLRSVRSLLTAASLLLGWWTLAGCGMPSAPADFNPGQNPSSGNAAGQAADTASDAAHDHRPGAEHLGRLVVTVPEGWQSEPPSGMFRLAQYRLPRAASDPEDGELVVTFFENGVGSVEDNLKRWEGQFENPRGKKTRTFAVDGMKVTALDISGTYTATGGPMMMASGPPKPNFRMLAALLEGPDGAYVFKLTGPVRTIAKWEKSFDAYLKSIRKH